MRPIDILVVCSNADIAIVIERLINNRPEWKATVVENEEAAIDILHSKDYKIVLLGVGTDLQTVRKMRALFSILKPGIQFVQHYGGGSGLLYNEIEYALAANDNPYTLQDNPFR